MPMSKECVQIRLSSVQKVSFTPCIIEMVVLSSIIDIIIIFNSHQTFEYIKTGNGQDINFVP